MAVPPLTSFAGVTHVLIIDKEHPMVGQHGTIGRRRYGDNGAWVTMASDPPDSVRAFPLDDPHGRGRHILLYPDQCDRLVLC